MPQERARATSAHYENLYLVSRSENKSKIESVYE
jgi:hypothetical protein